MHTIYTPLASQLLLLLLLLMLSLGTHLTEAAASAAAAVIGVGDDAAVDKEVAPVGVVKTDLLSLEQEIGSNPASERAARHARSFLFGVGGAGPAWIGGVPPVGYGYSWGYPSYGYYSSPYYSYGGYGDYYPSVFGFKKIIIG
ncbi:uncharacterized protein [Drosophila virilis]|uniref:Uncharacterized protein n=1 Tax=Drosophila virilis TaxID=7244 RepID=B4M0S9_DROVI|nr:uncharacterized protein LOC6630182 [Drosophila virilis]EDW67371.1 uncharacterized protein Dvir_GJ23115 [Drosophila virilis]